MTIKEIYSLGIKKAIGVDFRGKEKVKDSLAKKKGAFNKLSAKEQEFFDKESFANPYADSRILNIANDRPIKKVLVGIDISAAEILLARELGVDLVISHHPLGVALSGLDEVMDLQVAVYEQYGVPVNVGQKLLEPKISEVSRSLSPGNNERVVDFAKLVGVNLMCLHTVCDNLACDYLRNVFETKKFDRAGEVLDALDDIPEYNYAKKIKLGPKFFTGKKESFCGKIAVAEVTGGTEGNAKIYEWFSKAGIGTIVGMHISEAHLKEAEKYYINFVVAGHMSSDSLGVNLFIDELEKKGIEIIACGGFTRFSRNK